jgi:hypothetical protein
MAAPLRNDKAPSGSQTRFNRIVSGPGAKEPILTCPFTGKPVAIIQASGNGAYMARGDFWNTRLYHRKEELLYDLSQRLGVAPQFPRKHTISVTERVEPEPNPNADLVVADVMGDK